MGSIRRKTFTKPLPPGATRLVFIAILAPLFVAAGCDSRNTARQALERDNARVQQQDLKPAFAMAHCKRGVAYADKGETDKAIADLTEAIRLKPDFAEAYCNRGAAYDSKGDKGKAAEDFVKAKELGLKLPPAEASPHQPKEEGN